MGCLTSTAVRVGLFVAAVALAAVVQQITGLGNIESLLVVIWIPMLLLVIAAIKEERANSPLPPIAVPSPLTILESSGTRPKTTPIAAAFALYRAAEPLTSISDVLKELELAKAGDANSLRREFSMLLVAMIQMGIDFACRDDVALRPQMEMAFKAVLIRNAILAGDPITQRTKGLEPLKLGGVMARVDEELNALQRVYPSEFARMEKGGPHLWTVEEYELRGRAYLAARERASSRGETAWEEVGKEFARHVDGQQNPAIRQAGVKVAERAFLAPLSFFSTVHVVSE